MSGRLHLAHLRRLPVPVIADQLRDVLAESGYTNFPPGVSTAAEPLTCCSMRPNSAQGRLWASVSPASPPLRYHVTRSVRAGVSAVISSVRCGQRRVSSAGSPGSKSLGTNPGSHGVAIDPALPARP